LIGASISSAKNLRHHRNTIDLALRAIAITSWSAIGGVVVSTHEPARRHRAFASLTKKRTLRAFR
jgi:hypothetical protein